MNEAAIETPRHLNLEAMVLARRRERGEAPGYQQLLERDGPRLEMPRVASVEQDLVEEGSGFTSSIVSTYNLTSTILGAGILAVPLAFSRCGLVLGFGLLVMVAVLASLSCNLVLSSYLRTGKGSYGDLAEHLFGKAGSTVVKWVIILLNVGAASGYMVVVKQLLPRSLCEIFGSSSVFCDETGMDTSDKVESIITGIIVFGLVFPMSCVENLSSLRYTSMLAFLFAVFLTAAVAYRSIDYHQYCDVKLASTSTMDIFAGLPIFCFAFVCHLNVLPVYDQLRSRSPGKMRSVFRNAINFAAIIYGCCGVFGYLRFSCSEVPPNILSFNNGFPADDRIIAVARLAEALTCTLALPLIQHPTRIALHSWFFWETDDDVDHEEYFPAPDDAPAVGNVNSQGYSLLHPIDEEHTLTETANWRAERTRALIRALEAFLILTVSFVLAMVIPNISTLFGLLGSTLCALICFIFPGVFYLRATQSLLARIDRNALNVHNAQAFRRVERQRLLAWLLIVFGVLGGTIGTVATALSL